MSKKAWQSNTGDNVKQAGIESSGVGDNSTVTQSISETNSWSSSYADSHNDSHDIANYVNTDSHNVANTAISNSYHNASYDSHNSYTSVDSHDSYQTTNIDSHDVTSNVQNINASFTSTGQAVAFGVFFGKNLDVMLAVLAIAAAVIAWFAAEIMAMIAMIGTAVLAVGGVAALGIVSHMLVQMASNQIHARKVRQFEQDQAYQERQLLLEQREHELKLAELKRPVYVTLAQPAQLMDRSSIHMIEDHGIEVIEPVQEKVYVRRQNMPNGAHFNKEIN